jgi:hypothetical protein
VDGVVHDLAITQRRILVVIKICLHGGSEQRGRAQGSAAEKWLGGWAAGCGAGDPQPRLLQNNSARDRDDTTSAWTIN